MTNHQNACGSCRAIAGEIRLINADRLELDGHWRLEHAHPVAVAGWLVLVLRRHARALHDLTDDEAASLGRWLPAITRALHDATGCELEYVMQFAEGDGFHHVHFHLIARAPEWPSEYKGPAVFAAFGVDDPISAAAANQVMTAVGTALAITPQPVALAAE